VVPVRDPITNKLKDVILDRMDLRKVLVPALGKTAKIEAGTDPLPGDKAGAIIERESEDEYELEDFKWKTLRYIPGTDSEIVDHSEKEEEHNYDQEHYAQDTVALSVDEQTYWPELVNPPFPAGVLREITFTGRKEVTRYSDKIEDAIREKAEARMRKQFELEDKVRTPLQELKVEVKKTQRQALWERRAELEGVSTTAPKASEKQEEITSAPKKASEADIMVIIGRSMAKNLAKNPDAIDPSRRKLVEQVLAQEAARHSPPVTNARI